MSIVNLNTRLHATRLGRFLDALAHPAPRGPIPLREALPWLVPKVRPRFEYEACALRSGRPAPAFRPLAGSFAQSLVVDLPDQELDVGSAELAAWNVDFDRLLQKARSNLLARGGEEGFRQLGPGRYRSTWQDNLDGSRVLLPGILQRLELAGDPVVLLPDRDTLLVVGSDDPQGLAWALECAQEFLDEAPRSLNGCPLRLRNYRWEPFRARAEHPASPLLGRLEKRRLRDEYSHQKRLLDQRHGAQGKAINVTPFHLQKSPAGQVASVTIWSESEGEAWLAKADRVDLGGADHAEVPWETVQTRLAPYLEPVGLFPERYRFSGPSRPELLERLLA